MTDTSASLSGQPTSVSPATERAATRRTKYNLKTTLLDFLNWISARSETLSFGVDTKPVPSQPLVDEFVADRGLSVDNPDDGEPATQEPPTVAGPTPADASSPTGITDNSGRQPINEMPDQTAPGSNPDLTGVDQGNAPVSSETSNADSSATGSTGDAQTPPSSSDAGSTGPATDNTGDTGSTASTERQDLGLDSEFADSNKDGLGDDAEYHLFLDQHHATVISRVDDIENVAWLEGLLETEEKDKNRPAVVQAINSRLESLNQGV